MSTLPWGTFDIFGEVGRYTNYRQLNKLMIHTIGAHILEEKIPLLWKSSQKEKKNSSQRLSSEKSIFLNDNLCKTKHTQILRKQHRNNRIWNSKK